MKRMTINLLPKTDYGKSEWDNFFRALKINKKLFVNYVKDISKPDDPDEIVVRLLSPGKSGARVAVVSYIVKLGQQQDWVIKVMPSSPELVRLLQYEKDALDKYVKLLYPNIMVRVSGDRAIGYKFIRVENDFASMFDQPITISEIERIIYNIFSTLAKWYQKLEYDLQGFFEIYRLYDEVILRIRQSNTPELLDLWKDLEDKWPTTRGIRKSICHGDLNPTNILMKSQEDAAVIDFALTGFKHWATDFVRLERQLKFFYSNRAVHISKIVDTKFHFDAIVNDLNEHDNKILASIYMIRNQACQYFKTLITQDNINNEYPNFEQEYFHMLAFQQLCLLGSKTWNVDEPIKIDICNSTSLILKSLLNDNNKRSYFFGYFYVDINGQEKILLRKDVNNKWFFPICGFAPQGETIERAIDLAIKAFRTQNSLMGQAFFKAHFSRPEIIELCLKESDICTVEHDGKEVAVSPIFFKLKFGNEIEFNHKDYFWVKKTDFFNSGVYKTVQLICGQPNLLHAVRTNYIHKEYGLKIEECVDILVFRERNGKHEFLLLYRENPKEKYYGWEYPKGALEYHQTIHEGAIRELYEDMGIPNIGDFRFGGYLGFQTVDVSWRNKDYDTIRVHGLTYLRKLPHYTDSCKVEFPAFCSMYSAGVKSPSASCGRCSL